MRIPSYRINLMDKPGYVTYMSLFLKKMKIIISMDNSWICIMYGI